MSAYTHHGECSTSDPCKRCFEFGETTERRRIIKLLENKNNCNGGLSSGNCTCTAIALIKGEK